jgi:3-phosphoshikimate 1-carboxyvinyltransferase
MRLLAGLLSAQDFDSVLVGDESLSKRPMRRVIDPLLKMGARIESEPGGVPPLRIHGGQSLRGMDYTLEVASAQVKSAVLLAGLYAQGETVVREPHPTRDYTERMLSAFGVDIEFSPGHARLRGGQRLRATDIPVPADFSSAAFFIVAASIVPGSELRLRAVGLNPRRTGLLVALRAMGADITEENRNEHGGEPVADLVVRHAPLRGIEVPVEIVPDMIDEFPAGLRALGVQVDETADGATLHGGPIGSGAVDSHGDHRIAMAFSVAAQVASGEVRIGDVANVATSFPNYDALARSVGFGSFTGS